MCHRETLGSNRTTLMLIPLVWEGEGATWLLFCFLPTSSTKVATLLCHTSTKAATATTPCQHLLLLLQRSSKCFVFQICSVTSDEDKILMCYVYFANWSNDQISHPVSQGRHGCPITGFLSDETQPWVKVKSAALRIRWFDQPLRFRKWLTT